MVKSLDYNQLTTSSIKSQGGFGKLFDDRERVALSGPNQSPQLQRLGGQMRFMQQHVGYSMRVNWSTLR